MTAFTFDIVETAARSMETGVNSVTGQYELNGTAFDDDDTVGNITVPAGAVIKRVHLTTTELDTNASPTLTLNVGDATDEDRFIALATTGAALNFTDINASTITSNVIATGEGYEYLASDTDTTGEVGLIRVTGAAANATAATTGHILLTIDYTVNQF